MSINQNLGEDEAYLLDVLQNFEKLTFWELSTFQPKSNERTGPDVIKAALDKLQSANLTVTTKAGPLETVSINPRSREIAEELLSRRFESNHTTKERLLETAERDFESIPRVLALATSYDGGRRISFSDYQTDGLAWGLCSKLASVGMAFYSQWDSKKHSYRTFYLRRFPVDVAGVLEGFILDKINFKAIGSLREWTILLLAIATERPPRIPDLQLNLPGLTPSEVEETVYSLERKGILVRQSDTLILEPSMKKLALNYFLVEQSQSFKDEILRDAKRRIGELPSNLYYLGLVKRLLMGHSTATTEVSFLRIDRNQISGIGEEDLKEAAKLGLILLTQTEVILVSDVLRELESIFQAALKEQSLIFVHANNLVEMNIAWSRVFGGCTSYVKVQDEHVSEETLRTLRTFLPPRIDIKILSSIEGPRQLSLDEFKEEVGKLKTRMGPDKHALDLRFVGHSENHQAPFHHRYVISKNSCFLISHAIKDVGKTKEATIVTITKENKLGEVEPAFDYWFEAPTERLKEQGVTRLDYGEWATDKS